MHVHRANDMHAPHTRWIRRPSVARAVRLRTGTGSSRVTTGAFVQLDMLDAVDARKSLLVVAPTSSGKTFVSYYTMRHVLDANVRLDKARKPLQRAVFVMPTKALIIQTQGDLYNSYKGYIANSSTPVFASWSRDFRDPGHMKAQILITVPEILESLLLSPLPSHKAWVASVKCAPATLSARASVMIYSIWPHIRRSS